MIIGDLVQVSYEGTYAGQIWEMVCHYRVMSNAFIAPLAVDFQQFVNSLVVDWADDVWTVVDNGLVAGCVLRGGRFENLYNEQEIGEHTLVSPRVGVATGEGSAPETSFRFTCPTRRKGMNAGRKAFPGLAESQVGDAGALVGSAITLGGLVATALGEKRVSALTTVFYVELQPVVVKRILYQTPKGREAYRLPANSGEGVSYDATNWAVYPYTSTQNSRKRGRGK